MSTRKVTFPEVKYIAPVSLYGPLITPTAYDEKLVYRAVQAGYKVIEHSIDPKTFGAKVELTIANFNDKDRFTGKTEKVKADKSAITGTFATGKANVVNPLAPDAPVNVSVNTPDAAPVSIPIPTAAPINTGNKMSKAERKAAAKAAKEAEAKAKANEEVPETVAPTVLTEDPPVAPAPPKDDTTEETKSEPESLKNE